MGGESQLTVLIADDNDSDRMLLMNLVENLGYAVVTASNGQEALELFKTLSIDIILMDALMPGVDGFEAAKRIKAQSGDTLVPILFLTSLSDADSFARCFESGGSDVISKPYNKLILSAKISAFARTRELQNTVIEQRDRLALHHDLLVREQEVAKSVFDNIAHPGCISIPNIRYLLSPMAVFNGDLALVAKTPDNRMYVLLGDFTGHGLPAAIGALPVSEIFYGMTKKGFSIQEIIKEINKKLKKILPVGVFCCAGLIDFNFDNGQIKVWLGGLPDIYVYQPDKRDFYVISSKHLPIGVLEPDKFNADIQIFQMNVGDQLYMWSDGIHEACNDKHEMFGKYALKKVFDDIEDPTQLFDTLLKKVEVFTEGQEQDDDYTIVEITMISAEEFENNFSENKEKNAQVSMSGPMDWSLTYDLKPLTLKQFNPLPLLTHVLMDVPGLRPHSSRLYTILAELYSNALEHGLLGISSKLKESSNGFSEYYRQRDVKLKQLEEGYVRFVLNHTPTENGGCLTLRVEDSGNGFDYKKYDGPTVKEGYCGRGIPLLQTMCSRFEYIGKGNIVEADFKWTLS